MSNKKAEKKETSLSESLGLDRFMFKINVPFPDDGVLKDIVILTQKKQDVSSQKVIGASELLEMREVAREVPVTDSVLSYAVKLISDTHPETPDASPTAKKYIRYGASPRAAQAIISGSKVRALMEGRFNVSKADIDALSLPVLRHRLGLNFEAVSEGLTCDDVIKMLLE